jgi:hypothetical protein
MNFPGWTVTRMDALFARVNTGQSCEIPTGVGFCLFIRRGCLDDVGFFDEQRFGRGYGEENDFCLRASARGWVNRLCADVFVYHAGGRASGRKGSPNCSREAAAQSWRCCTRATRNWFGISHRLDPIAPARGEGIGGTPSPVARGYRRRVPACCTCWASAGRIGAARAAVGCDGPVRAAPMHLILFLGAPDRVSAGSAHRPLLSIERAGGNAAGHRGDRAAGSWRRHDPLAHCQRASDGPLGSVG